ncbi:MAG: hypothetical protein LBU79_09835 [Planctomycetota bacterium]|jgi:hypothetical protein|nr:hypothetical protein [Planctomycetota bacterium]
MLYIAEKPELARASAEGLGASTRRNGYYEGRNDHVAREIGAGSIALLEHF